MFRVEPGTSREERVRLRRKYRKYKRPTHSYYQGNMDKWIGVGEKPANFVNDKREYYRSTYLKSWHWKNLKASKLRAMPHCERCPNTTFLDVHHKNYRNLYDVTLDDLETLCRKCHTEEHKKKDLDASLS